jgi:hypothetical protein
MAENNRTAIDILLNLEQKVFTLDKRIQNSETLLKLLLAKFNDSASVQNHTVLQNIPVVQPTIINKDNFESRPVTNKFSELASAYGIPIDEQVAKDSISGNMSEAKNRGSSRINRNTTNLVSKSAISQTLNYETSPLFLANVEFFNKNGELISQTRTNTKGKWLMTLEPGNYNVHVSKRFPPDSGKKSIDTNYNIEIFSSDKPVELNPLSLNDNG